ncbi:MAG: hypothetical protein ACSLEN_14085 [Candidatus Malihini olakiniferum]
MLSVVPGDKQFTLSGAKTQQPVGAPRGRTEAAPDINSTVMPGENLNAACGGFVRDEAQGWAE